MKGKRIDSKTERLLNDVIGNSNERDLFIRTALYAENAIDAWLERRFNMPEKVLDNRFFFYDLKLDILKRSGQLVDPYLYNLKEISEIRNRYAHKLDPNENVIKQMILTMKVPPNATIRVDRKKDYLQYFKLVSVYTITELESALKYKRPLFVRKKKS